METSRAVMPLLTELGGLGEGFCYKHVAPDRAFSVSFSTGLDGFLFQWLRLRLPTMGRPGYPAQTSLNYYG